MEKELKEYQVCYYRNDDYFMNGDMSCFKSFDEPKRANKYIDYLRNHRKGGFIQLLLKSDDNYAEDFEVKDEPIYHSWTIYWCLKIKELDRFMRDHDGNPVYGKTEHEANELAKVFTECSDKGYHYEVVKCY